MIQGQANTKHSKENKKSNHKFQKTNKAGIRKVSPYYMNNTPNA